MEKVSKFDFDGIDPDTSNLPVKEVKSLPPISQKEMDLAIKELDRPVESMKKLAATLGHYIELKSKRELKDNGFLSDYTRRWVSLYNDLLNNLQKSMYGEKSMSLHMHGKVSHAQVNTLIRKHSGKKVTEEEAESDVVDVEFREEKEEKKK